MRKSCLLLLLIVIGTSVASIATDRTTRANFGPKLAEAYVGDWSNGRGETLKITVSTIRFASDNAVSYRDVTRVTDGKEFNLEITTEGKLNYLTRFLHISMGQGDKPDEMKMTLYDSRKDMEDGENSQGEATWYRDK